MKQLIEEFNLPDMEDDPINTNTINPIMTVDDVEVVNNGLSMSEKINAALKEIKSYDVHSEEMNDISEKALDSYTQLMTLGMNVSDMAAGKIFAEASTFLKLAFESRDAKSRARATELDLMLKKLRIDRMNKSSGGIEDGTATQIFDRNDLLKIMKEDPAE